MRKISTKNVILMVAGIVACTASLSQAALSTWTGTGTPGDWNDGNNWAGNVPSVDATYGLNTRANTIVIDGSVTPQPSINVPTTFDGYNTPGFSLSNGATLAVAPSRFRENGGSTGNSGNIATVTGNGSHLTFNSSAANQGWVLSREQNATEIWTVSDGGKVTLDGTGRADMSFNNARLTEINLNNGTFEINAGNIYGTRGNRDLFTATARNEVHLNNGSLIDYAGYFQGNLYSEDINFTGFATLNFDLMDTASVVRFKAGTSQGVFGNAANIDSAFGTTFTTSIVGGYLVSTDIGGGYYEVTAEVPEPASLGLIAMGVALIAMRRKSVL